MWHICKFGNIDDNNYQYCLKCNKARSLPCNHVWEIIDKQAIRQTDFRKTEYTTGFLHLQQCKKCGELKEFKQQI